MDRATAIEILQRFASSGSDEACRLDDALDLAIGDMKAHTNTACEWRDPLGHCDRNKINWKQRLESEVDQQ